MQKSLHLCSVCLHQWGVPPPPCPSRTLVLPHGGVGDRLLVNQNHLEERLLDQAQARALYTPPFFWVICVAYPKA